MVDEGGTSRMGVSLVRVKIEKLFGFVDHDVELRKDATIVTGPNGTGKTHFLRLIRAALVLDVDTLLDISYERLTLTFSDSTGMRVLRFVDGEDDLDPFVEATALTEGEPVGKALRLDQSKRPNWDDRVPPWVELVGGIRFTDRRNGQTVPSSYLRSRWNVNATFDEVATREEYPELTKLWNRPVPVLIETNRLDDALPDKTARQWSEGPTAAARINDYIRNLQREISSAKRRSNDITQRSDTSFAERALAVANATINEDRLREKYQRTVKQFNALARNSLVVGSVPIEFPAKTTPTVRRILQVFLDDWSRRLEPLMPLNERLTAYRDVLDGKLKRSGKHTNITAQGELEFKSANGGRIEVAQLSSGEKHLLALFSSLLFSGAGGNLVLIDEPEISLHAVWKHSFLADAQRIAHLQGQQLVLASHSTSIINSRWDLTEELSFPEVSTLPPMADSDESLDWDGPEVQDA